jgi:hypothetical protein
MPLSPSASCSPTTFLSYVKTIFISKDHLFGAPLSISRHLKDINPLTLNNQLPNPPTHPRTNIHYNPPTNRPKPRKTAQNLKKQPRNLHALSSLYSSPHLLNACGDGSYPTAFISLLKPPILQSRSAQSFFVFSRIRSLSSHAWFMASASMV